MSGQLEQMRLILESIAQKHGYRVTYDNLHALLGHEKHDAAVFHYPINLIIVHNQLEDKFQVKALGHEIGHVLFATSALSQLETFSDLDQQLLAELISRILWERLGPSDGEVDGYSESLIAGYLNMLNRAEVPQSLYALALAFLN